MKISFRQSMLLGSSLIVMLIACGKLKDLLNPEWRAFNDDSNDVKLELDDVDWELNEHLGNFGSGKTDENDHVASSPLCGALIDSTDYAQNILYINFDGQTPCFSPSRTRTGQIKVELVSGNSWHQAGAVIRQTFIGYKITRMSDNRSIEFNGVKTLKNVNGTNWIGFFLSMNSLSFAERALNIDVTFDNGQTAVWNSAREVEWSWVQGNSVPGIQQPFLRFRASGDTTILGHAVTDSWGVNRFGQDFVTYYNQDIESNTYCGLWRPVAGELVHEVEGNTFGLRMGVDQNGNPSSANCAYGYEVSWDVNGTANSQVFSY